MKTDTEMLNDLRQTMSKESWQDLVNMRVEAASLGECVEAAAEIEGKTVEEFVNPGTKAMHHVMAEIDAENAKKADAQRKAAKARLLEQAEMQAARL